MKYREPWKTKKMLAREALELARLKFGEETLHRSNEEVGRMYEVEHKRVPTRPLMPCRYREGAGTIFLCYAAGEGEDCCARLCIGCRRRRA